MHGPPGKLGDGCLTGVRCSCGSGIPVASPTANLAVAQCEDVGDRCIDLGSGFFHRRGPPRFGDHMITRIDVPIDRDIAIRRAFPNGLEEISDPAREVSIVRHRTGAVIHPFRIRIYICEHVLNITAIERGIHVSDDSSIGLVHVYPRINIRENSPI